ncbi:MAG: hypothetical protein H8E98_04285 [Bacteroidetes bacterium]|nr:hypothetical protein [Bacteroidota bacterium]
MNKKYKKITELFNKDFHSDKFYCGFIKECEVSIGKEPIYASYFGEEKSIVMLVAEAPSSSNGVGVNNVKYFDEIENDKKSPLYLIKNFIKEQYNEIPYFTDLVKCGLAKQKNKKILKKRAEYCLKKYLLNEIEIIKPEIIICVGKLSYEFISKAQENSDISKDIKVVNIIHYSRQANLPLDDEDKEFLWKIQLEILKHKQIENTSLTELSYIKNIIKKNL